jgi:hypothetical protein
VSKTGKTLVDFPTLNVPDVVKASVRKEELNDAQKNEAKTVQREIKRDSEMMLKFRKRYALAEERYDIEELEDRVEDKGEDVPVIITQFGQWLITPIGIEATETFYFIERSRVEDTDWIAHMSEKDWVNMEDFTRALYHASRIYHALDALEGK